MATLDEVATTYARRQDQYAALAQDHARAAWVKIDPGNIAASWVEQIPTLAATLAIGQQAAATDAQTYVTAVVLAQGATPAPAAQVDPAAFAGSTASGGPLVEPLMLPPITALRAISLGMLADQAMQLGLAQLLRFAGNEIGDAGRVATGVATTVETRVIGYVRHLRPPSCSRCAVLAGRLYRWSDGFQRHPLCDCQHSPITREEWNRHETSVTDSPRKYFDSLSHAKQSEVFGPKDAQAIRDGADITQVVNARAGVYTAGGRKYTTSATTVRGLAGKRLGELQKQASSRYRVSQVRRLTPEQIYAESNGDRSEALRLLQRFGYITT